MDKKSKHNIPKTLVFRVSSLTIPQKSNALQTYSVIPETTSVNNVLSQSHFEIIWPVAGQSATPSEKQ